MVPEGFEMGLDKILSYVKLEDNRSVITNWAAANDMYPLLKEGDTVKLNKNNIKLFIKKLKRK